GVHRAPDRSRPPRRQALAAQHARSRALAAGAAGLTPAWRGSLPAQGGGLERGVAPAGVGRVDGDPGSDYLIYAVEDRLIEPHLGCAELRVEVLDRARADDGGGHGGVVDHERERHLDQRDARLFGELRERRGGLELWLVDGQREVGALRAQ